MSSFVTGSREGARGLGVLNLASRESQQVVLARLFRGVHW
jgi:hypothetical protein